MSDVPDEARPSALPAGALTYGYAAYMDSVSGDEQNGGTTYEDVKRALEAAAPFLVAAERQRLHDLEARIEAVADEVEDWIGEPDLSWNDAQQGFERILAMLQDIPTDVGDPLAALVSPVSDDTGGTAEAEDERYHASREAHRLTHCYTCGSESCSDEACGLHVIDRAGFDTCPECGHDWKWHAVAGCSADVSPSCTCPVRIVRALVSEASVSPVSDDTGGTKPVTFNTGPDGLEHRGSCRIFYAENRCTCGAARGVVGATTGGTND